MESEQSALLDDADTVGDDDYADNEYDDDNNLCLCY